MSRSGLSRWVRSGRWGRFFFFSGSVGVQVRKGGGRSGNIWWWSVEVEAGSMAVSSWALVWAPSTTGCARCGSGARRAGVSQGRRGAAREASDGVGPRLAVLDAESCLGVDVRRWMWAPRWRVMMGRRRTHTPQCFRARAVRQSLSGGQGTLESPPSPVGFSRENVGCG